MKKIILGLVVLLSVFLVSCDLVDVNKDSETVEITHTVTINGVRTEVTEEFRVNPKVVGTLVQEFADIVISLGQEKMGISKLGLVKGSSLPPVLSSFENDSLYPNLGTAKTPSKDDILLFSPDLIILGGRTAGFYEEYKNDFPNTDILDISNTSFSVDAMEQIYRNIAKIFPSIEEELLGKLDVILNGFENIRNNFKNKTVLILGINGDNISSFGAKSRFGFIYNELGFNNPDPLNVATESHGKQISVEEISRINPDVIIAYDRAVIESSGSASIDLVAKNTLVLQTTAGKNNEIYMLDSYAWYLLPGGIISSNQMITDLNQLLA